MSITSQLVSVLVSLEVKELGIKIGIVL